MGMFGNLGRTLTQPGAKSGLSLADRLAIFATAAGGDYGSALSIRNAPLERARKAQEDEFVAKFGSKLGPQYDGGSEAPTVGAGGNAADWQYQAPQRTSDGLDINSPELPGLALKAQRLGVPITQLLDVLKAQKLDMKQGSDGSFYNPADPNLAGKRLANRTNINGWIRDLNNPTLEGSYSPDLGKGMMPNGKGGVTNIDGFTPALQAQEEATTLGKTYGTVYQRPNIGPDGAGDGTTTPTLGRRMFAGPDGPGRTQAPADAIRAEGSARGDLERDQARLDRAAAAPKQLAALDEMEKLLPDVISGFGADMRINANRAMALAGNPDAQRKVKATETFINQGRVLVASIIKTFGSNPTEGERKFAEKMSGADADLNPETLAEGIKLQRARIYRELEEAGAVRNGGRSPSAAPPAVGAVVRGYRFKGGDPASPSSWTRN